MEKNVIEKINRLCNGNQGVFLQPNFIPVDVKELVIYTSYETGGYRGGGYRDEDEPRRYVENEPEDKWKVLDLVLEELSSDISYLQYKRILRLVHTNEETQREYYGNSTDWKAEYIILSELENLLRQIK